ncbi:MAG: Holliday junction resolvase RecU [Oscillospiraceae bacterium]
MRKGYSFETQLNRLCTQVQSLGYHAQKNHADRTNDGKYLCGEPFDYIILTPNYKCAFDAKESQSERWSLTTNAKLEQINNLKHCKNAGLDAFFLVYFYPARRFVKFDVDFIIACIQNGTKSVTVDIGEKWGWERLLKGA